MPYPSDLLLPAAAQGTLAAMITPAVLISACGTLALSTSNRIGRVVDRVRELTAAVEAVAPGDAPPELLAKRQLIGSQLGGLASRLRLLQTSLTTLYAALGLFVAASLTIGLDAAVRVVPDSLPSAFGMLGAAAMFSASVLLVRETRLAVRGSLEEMAYLDRLMQAKLGEELKLGAWRGGL